VRRGSSVSSKSVKNTPCAIRLHADASDDEKARIPADCTREATADALKTPNIHLLWKQEKREMWRGSLICDVDLHCSR
jgi:hypothetical protein